MKSEASIENDGVMMDWCGEQSSLVSPVNDSVDEVPISTDISSSFTRFARECVIRGSAAQQVQIPHLLASLVNAFVGVALTWISTDSAFTRFARECVIRGSAARQVQISHLLASLVDSSVDVSPISTDINSSSQTGVGSAYRSGGRRRQWPRPSTSFRDRAPSLPPGIYPMKRPAP